MVGEGAPVHDAAVRPEPGGVPGARRRQPSASARLHRLLDAGRSIAGDLSLSSVLQRVVEAAQDVADARYAALGVVGPDGSLEQFLHVGMDPDAVRAVGRLPDAQGLLGVLGSDPRPLRLAQLTQDPRAAGFPPGHPPMTSLLGVPVRTRSTVFGALYLADRRGGGAFSEEDEQLVLALAATAGVAIENARLYEEAQVRQDWLRAAGEVDQVLLAADVDDREALRRVATSVQRLTKADVVVVVLPSATTVDQLEVV